MRFRFDTFAIVSFLTYFIILNFTQILAQQTQTDTTASIFLPNKNNRLYANSTKHLNTLNFDSDLFYQHEFGKINFGLDAQLGTAYFFTSQESYRTSQRLKIFGDYLIFPNLRTGVLINRNYFNDNKRLSISNVEVNQGVAYAMYFNRFLRINLFGGFSKNLQSETTDDGFTYGAEGSVKDFFYQNQNINGFFHFSNEDISPRKNYEHNANFTLLSLISSNFTNEIAGFYSEQRRDFYVKIDSVLGEHFNTKNNIERRVEKKLTLSEKISYNLSKGLKFDFGAKIFSQEIKRQKKYILPQYVTISTFDPATDRVVLDFNASVRYLSPKLGAYAKINYYEKEELYSISEIQGADETLYLLRQKQEERKNNTSQLGYLSLGGSYSFSSANKISFDLLHRKLKYDTPSNENFDDRDELLTTFRLRFMHRFSYFFKMNFDVEGSRNHVVYIFAERSSNNNIKRILKFTTTGIYKGKNVVSVNSAAVSANYTVYDFEDVLQNFRSFAFRQVSFKDSSSVFFTKNLGVNFWGYLKLSEQGELDWDDFAEQPMQLRQELFLETFLFNTVWILKIGAGARAYILKTSNFKGLDTIPAEEYSSVGPSFLVTTISPLGKVNLLLHGWYEFIDKGNNATDRNLNFNLNFSWKI